MSHTTTQDTPQWAFDVASAIDRAGFGSWRYRQNERVRPDYESWLHRVAAIIARHAPKREEPILSDNSTLRETIETVEGIGIESTAQWIRDLKVIRDSQQARIAELEAENARLRADLSHACGKLRAIANGGPEIVDFDSVDEVREFARISLEE